MKSNFTNYLSYPFFSDNKALKITDRNVSHNSQLVQDKYYYSVEFVCINGDRFIEEGELKLIKLTKK